MHKKSTLWSTCLISVMAAIILSPRTLCAQDFTIHMKGDNGVEGTTYYVTSNAVRRTSPGLNDVIDRMDRGTIIYLNHRNKTYAEVPAAELRAKIADRMNGLDPQKKA